MAETMVMFNLQAFEHARIDRNMKIRELGAKIGRHPGSISNLLLKARRGEPLGVSQIAAMAWGLSIPTEQLMIYDQSAPLDAQPERAQGCQRHPMV